MRISVICCIYNSEPLVRRTLDALKRTASPFTEVILVNNHPLDEAAEDLIHKLDWVKVVDPGKNLGCHEGWNFGYQHSVGAYVVKLDDDTEILTPGWGDLMSQALKMCPEIGFISADIDAKQANKYRMVKHFDHEFEVADNGVVGFSHVMFRREDVQRWGPMKAGRYYAAGGRPVTGERLYGGEEVFYADAARSENKLIAHFPAVKCHHMDNRERHPHYPLWKWAYGYTAWTSKPMDEWISSGDYKNHYRCAIAHVAAQSVPNDAQLVDWIDKLAEFAESNDRMLMDAIKHRTQNGAVHEKCNQVLSKLAAEDTARKTESK